MIKLLVKNRLRGTVSGMLRQGKQGSRAKIVLFAILFAYIFACLIFLSSIMSLSLGSVMIPAGASWLYFAIFTLASLTVIFILSIFEMKSELFDCKDNDLLLSMPIPQKALVVSRVIVVLIFNYIIEAFVFVPAIVVYAIFSHDVLGVIGSVLVALFVPLLATALSSGVGYAVAYVAKKIRKSSLVSIILSLAFLALYFWGYNALIEGMDSFLLSFDPEALKGNLKILVFIGNASLLKPLPLITVIAVCSLVSLLAFVILSKNYIRIATSNKGFKKIKYKAQKTDARSALSALCRKELRKFFTSSLYMLNSGLGLVFTVVLSVVALINADVLGEVSLGLFGNENAIASIFAAALVMLSTMNMMSASALSLEGRNLWIIKTVPIKDSTLILSKVLPQIIITTPPVLISSLLVAIASGADFIYWLFIIMTPIIANVAFAFLGLIFNILAPRFEFDNEAYPIKQSLAVFATMMIQMLIGLGLVVATVALLFVAPPLISAFAGFGFVTLLALVFGLILFIPCKQKYAKM